MEAVEFLKLDNLYIDKSNIMTELIGKFELK